MNRRDFLIKSGKALIALSMGRALSSPHSSLFTWPDQDEVAGTLYGPSRKPPTIEDIVNGGSESRRELMDKLTDGPTLMRHATNLRANYIRAHADYINEEREKNPGKWLPQYNILQGDIDEIDLTLERLDRMGLTDFMKGTSIKTAIDPDFYLAKISTESVGDPYALSHAGAIGISQMLAGTYNDMRRHTNGMIRNIREQYPQETLDYLLERPLRDLLLVDSKMLESMGVPMDYDKRYIKDVKEYVDIWMPYSIIAMKEYGAFPGGSMHPYDALVNPSVGLEAGALTALNFWLTTYSATKDRNLVISSYDPGHALARPSFPLVPQAPASAYIRGQNGASNTMSRIVENAVEPYTILEGMKLFDDENTFSGNLYSSELMRKTEYLKRVQS
ncbi:MAG: hypothetical protein ACMXYL_00610 [Candidatus Woesearchaeota archaeon]